MLSARALGVNRLTRRRLGLPTRTLGSRDWSIAAKSFRSVIRDLSGNRRDGSVRAVEIKPELSTTNLRETGARRRVANCRLQSRHQEGGSGYDQEGRLRAVKAISQSQRNDGYGADSGRSRGGRCRGAIRPKAKLLVEERWVAVDPIEAFKATIRNGGAVTRTDLAVRNLEVPVFCSRRGGGPPRLESFVSEDAERVTGGEMALDVEGVLDSGVNGKEALG
jgi:hypothetical protein